MTKISAKITKKMECFSHKSKSVANHGDYTIVSTDNNSIIQNEWRMTG